MDVTSNTRQTGTLAVGGADGASLGNAKPIGPRGGQRVAQQVELSAAEIDRFLRIVARASGVRSHYELFQLLQGDVQFFIPHQILVVAWGDFRGPNLVLDIVSSLPGVRTGLIEGCPISEALRKLHASWLVAGREAMQLDDAAFASLLRTGCECALHRSLRSMRTAVVHGSHDARDDTYSFYLASGAAPDLDLADDGIGRFRFLIDSVLAQIEIAFRRVGVLRSSGGSDMRQQESPKPTDALSAREQEILMWVSEGRTNREISRILSLSEFTVKNHMQRILRKLDVANRAEAVARYRRSGELPRSWRGPASAMPLAD